MARRRVWLAVAAVAGTSLAACGADSGSTSEGLPAGGQARIELDGTEESVATTGSTTQVVTGTANLTKVSQVTGPDSPNTTDAVAVAGTDLGSMVNVGDRTYFVFGDTFGGRAPGMTGGGGSNWRSNALAWTTDDEPEEGISLDGWVVDDIGLASELLPSQKQDGVEMTKIPTNGFTADGNLYLAYMSVRHWGEPGEWEANYSSLARSQDDGQTWELLDDVRWPGDSNFVQVAAYRVDDGETHEIYFWSIPAGRSGSVQLMKVDEAEVESPAAYRYFTGTDGAEPQWVDDPSAATTIVEGGVGEPSVIWNADLGRWLMSHQRDNADAVIRESPTPWGPWSEPHELVSAAEHPGLYAPFMNARYLRNEGTTLYFALSLWDPYNVFWFRADLLTTPG